MVPVKPVLWWCRFLSHSFTFGEKDLIAFRLETRHGNMVHHVLLQLDFRCWEASSFKRRMKSLSVSWMKQDYIFSQPQALWFSFNWLWSILWVPSGVWRALWCLITCCCSRLLSLGFALNSWFFFFLWALMLQVFVTTSKLTCKCCPFKTKLLTWRL